MEDPPIDSVVPIVPEKKKRKNEGRPVTEKQREALRKGFEAIKVKREQLAKEKAERKEKGLPEPPKIPKKLVPVDAVLPLPPKEKKPRKEYIRPPVNERKTICRDDFNALKQMVEEIAKKPAEKVVEKEPVEKVIEREIVKEKVISSSELLNRIFFNK